MSTSCTGGTAYGSGGSGWFNYTSYLGSAGSVGKGLKDNGFTGGEIIDSKTTATHTGSTDYMIYVDQNHYTIWATIENPSAQDTATLSSCYFSAYDNYSANAVLRNYCVSSS